MTQENRPNPILTEGDVPMRAYAAAFMETFRVRMAELGAVPRENTTRVGPQVYSWVAAWDTGEEAAVTPEARVEALIAACGHFDWASFCYELRWNLAHQHRSTSCRIEIVLRPVLATRAAPETTAFWVAWPNDLAEAVVAVLQSKLDHHAAVREKVLAATGSVASVVDLPEFLKRNLPPQMTVYTTREPAPADGVTVRAIEAP